MHIQNWNDSPVIILKWATIEPPLHSNEWVQLFFFAAAAIARAFVHAGVYACLLGK